ncbi:MAG: putative bifunctional diguanylate cyclase/phosphodiesterase [Pseudomonadales bacterium]
MSVLLWFVGGLLRELYGTVGDLSSERSLVPDLFTLPGYVLSALACLGFSRARNPRRDLDALLDGLMPAVAALVGAWLFLIGPALAAEHVPGRIRLVLSCYPPASVLVLAMAIRVAFYGTQRPALSQRLYVGTLVWILAGDVLFMLVDARIAAVDRTFLDLPYSISAVCMSLTALHPSMRILTERANTEDRVPGRWRLILVTSALGLPGLVALGPVRTPGDRWVVVVSVLLLTAIGAARVFRALREHASSQQRLLYQATHDAVTGLPNRVYVGEHLQSSLSELQQQPPSSTISLAVIYVDVDRFKLVNDSCGHAVGDELLAAVADRLVSHVRPGDVVGRVGGDEFVVVTDEVVSLAHATGLAEKLHAAFQEPFLLSTQEIFTSASLGVAFADPCERPALGDDLLRNADMAMYEAKQAGRDGVAVFDASMRDRVAERNALEQELRIALVARELHAHYQPIVDVSRGAVAGLEALMRWQHPVRGLVPPSKFVPIAEETGLISEFGVFILNEACRELAGWRKLPNGTDLYVSVNLSPRQLRDPSLVDSVQSILERHRLPPSALCLELTESMLMEEPERAEETLRRLRAAGVRLSIDDFGTGYSSLAYLKRFPVDQVKIDKSFVDGLGEADSTEDSLVAAIVAMAKALHISTVAEGVETSVQLDRLSALGCRRLQGFYFSRPVMPHLVGPTIERLTHDLIGQAGPMRRHAGDGWSPNAGTKPTPFPADKASRSEGVRPATAGS